MRILTTIRNRRFRRTVASHYVGPIAPISGIVSRLAITLALSVLPADGTLSAQPKSPEIFSTIGTLQLGTDDGTLGRAVSYGGGFTVPVTGRMYLGFDFETAQIRDIHSLEGEEDTIGNHYGQRLARRRSTARFRAGHQPAVGLESREPDR